MTKRLPPFLLVVLFALSFLAPSWTGGVGPGALGAASVAGLPPGASAYFNAASGFVPSDGGSGSWTSSIGPHTWVANNHCTSSTTINGKAAVSFPSIGLPCQFVSDTTADTYFSSSCWTIATVYQYTGTTCGTSCPTLDWSHSPELLSGSDRYEQFLVANLGPSNQNAAAIAAETRLAAPPWVALSQVNGNPNTTALPHYGIVSACGGQLISYLDGVASTSSAIGAINLSTNSLTISAPTGFDPSINFYGAISILALWPSQPNLASLNAWLRYAGGF